MGVLIRNATKDDVEVLGLIYSLSYQAAFKDIIPDNILENVFSLERRTDGLMKEISVGTPVNTILFYEDIPVGLLTYGKPKDEDSDDSSIEIWRIYLLPTYWGQNVGIDLLDWGIKEIQGKGHKKIILWVLEENSRARKFYEKMGFIHDGVTRVINVGKELTDLRYIRNL
jgi:GNAT superfamily N-acetyltransferase